MGLDRSILAKQVSRTSKFIPTIVTHADTRNLCTSSHPRIPHQMAESGIIIAYLDGLGSRATPQVVGSLRADLKRFATGGDFKRAQRTLCRYRGDVEVEDG